MSNLRSGTDSNARKAALYREAARLIENRSAKFACHALRGVGLGCKGLSKVYENAARKDARQQGRWDRSCAWLSYIADDFEDQQNGRILALCFMAAMVEAGDA